MIRSLKHAMLVLVILFPAPALLMSQTTGQGVAEDSVRAAEYARKQALLTADTILLSRLTASDFYEVNRFGQLRTRASNMLEIATQTLKLTRVSYDSLSVHIYGDVAILTGIANNTGEYRGIPFAGRIRYTRIFTRRDGRWQAVVMQHTPMP